MYDLVNVNGGIQYGRKMMNIEYCRETLYICGMKAQYYSTPNLPCPLTVSLSTLLFPLFLLLERWYEACSRNSNHTVKAFPLNYWVMVSFYRHMVYLWPLLKAWYLAAVFRVYLYSTVDHIAVVHDVSLYHSQWQCRDEKGGQILMSTILEMAAALFVSLLCSIHQ